MKVTLKKDGKPLEAGDLVPGKVYRFNPQTGELNRRQYGPNHRRWELDTRPLQCRVDPETRKQVEDYARSHHLSIAEVLRQFVEWGLEIDNATLRRV